MTAWQNANTGYGQPLLSNVGYYSKVIKKVQEMSVSFMQVYRYF